MIKFTSDTPVNDIDPEIPELEDISENASSNHEEEMDIESSDESELPHRARKHPSYLDDYVTREEVEEEQQQNNLALFSTSYDPNTYDEASKLKVWRDAMKQ